MTKEPKFTTLYTDLIKKTMNITHDILLKQVMNHGITEDFLDKIYKLTKQFFALPTEEKQKYERDIGNVQGYGSDMILSDDQILDWIDRLFLTTYPEDQQNLKFWPEVPTGFR